VGAALLSAAVISTTIIVAMPSSAIPCSPEIISMTRPPSTGSRRT
jgi:threonine/homoserine efflux transporter RhtA